jgi:hypothetical protein
MAARICTFGDPALAGVEHHVLLGMNYDPAEIREEDLSKPTSKAGTYTGAGLFKPGEGGGSDGGFNPSTGLDL